MPTYFFIFWSSLLAVVLIAVIFGGGIERRVVVAYFAAALASLLLPKLTGARYDSVNLIRVLIDVVLLAYVGSVALRNGHWWLRCSVAALALPVLGHLAKAADPHLWRLGYQMLTAASGMPAVLLLAFGIVRHRRLVMRARLRGSSAMSM